MGLGLSVVAVVGMLACGWASAATTEEVLAKLTKQQGAVKTFECDMKSIMSEPGQEGETVGHMAMEVIVKDGKPAGSKMNMKQTMTSKEGAVSTMLVVNDGEFLWVEMKSPESDRVMVMKQKGDSVQGKMSNPNEFNDMFDLKLVGEEDFDGQRMWVLEGTPKPKPKTPARGMMMEPPMPGKVRMFVGQKDTLCHRYIMYNKAGKETVDTQMTKMKLNGKLDPALFKYTPPRGAQVMDMSKGMPNLDDLKKMIPEGVE
jgi:outer membrane lipoprotein-sorting protein